jgi:hypothetical protein
MTSVSGAVSWMRSRQRACPFYRSTSANGRACGPPGAVGAAGLLPRNQQISGLPPLLSSSEAMRILCKTSGGWIPFVYIRSNSELRKRTTERAGRAVARIMRDLEFLEALDLQYLEQVEALLGKIRSKAIHLDLSSSTQGELQRNAPRMQRDAPRGSFTAWTKCSP